MQSPRRNLAASGRSLFDRLFPSSTDGGESSLSVWQLLEQIMDLIARHMSRFDRICGADDIGVAQNRLPETTVDRGRAAN